MNREDILQALARLNDAIASLNVRLHPPPDDPGQQQELESELAQAEQSRESLEQALNNLPVSAPAPDFAAPAARTLTAHAAAQNVAAIRMSEAARNLAKGLVELVEPVDGPQVKGGIKPPKTKGAT